MKLLRISIVVLTLMLSASGAVFSQDLAGCWQGTLDAMGSKLRLVIHFEKSDSGWSATLDSPDQGATGIQCGRIMTPADSLIVTVPVIGGRYLGRCLPDSDFYKGVWQQGGLSFPLDLARTEAPAALVRPQEPKPPYPYKIEEVVVTNDAAGLKLAGSLTLPQGKGPFPAVLLITGSGAQDRDEQLLGHRPFWIIADHLSRHGYAVLRCDDRGTGASTGNFSNATSLDFSGDVAAEIAFLSGRSEINAKKIILLGHSEGGLIAPMVAAKNGSIAGIILLAGPGVKGEEILLAQGELIGRAMGMAEKSLQQQRHGQETLFALLREGGPDLETRMRNALVALRSEIPEADKAKMSDQAIEMQVKQLASPWFRFFLTYDPAPTLARVKCPVLALNGALDLQVPADANLAAIASALQRGGNRQFETHKIDGLNHLFQTAKTGSVEEYGKIEETVSPRALELITGWLATVCK